MTIKTYIKNPEPIQVVQITQDNWKEVKKWAEIRLDLSKFIGLWVVIEQGLAVIYSDEAFRKNYQEFDKIN